jgi:hypothetical protein
MIRLHAGRLLLVCDRADRTWHARVILGPKPEHQLEIDTGSVDLREAFIRAQRIYVATRRKLRPDSEPRKCWDCGFWDMATQRCEMGLPESKRSGGRYAVRCELYERA